MHSAAGARTGVLPTVRGVAGVIMFVVKVLSQLTKWSGEFTVCKHNTHCEM